MKQPPRWPQASPETGVYYISRNEDWEKYFRFVGARFGRKSSDLGGFAQGPPGPINNRPQVVNPMPLSFPTTGHLRMLGDGICFSRPKSLPACPCSAATDSIGGRRNEGNVRISSLCVRDFRRIPSFGKTKWHWVDNLLHSVARTWVSCASTHRSALRFSWRRSGAGSESAARGSSDTPLRRARGWLR